MLSEIASKKDRDHHDNSSVSQNALVISSQSSSSSYLDDSSISVSGAGERNESSNNHNSLINTRAGADRPRIMPNAELQDRKLKLATIQKSVSE